MLRTEKNDPRFKRTRSMILQSFMEILPEKGFQAVSVQDITDKAGINRATFYAHFPDKYALLDHSIQLLFRQEIEKRMLDACHYSAENLKALIIMVCEFISNANSHCAPSEPQFESLVETQIKKQIYDLLTVWLKQTKTSISTEIPVTVATWAIYGLASFWSHSKKRPALNKFVDEALPLIAVNLEQFAGTA
jgi:AcrR family transcriptional regulator